MSKLSCDFFTMVKYCVILTEVIGHHQEALERFLGFTDEVDEVL